MNYRSHVKESGLCVEDFPFNTIFTKAPSCITAADASGCPRQVELLDYEIELGLVLAGMPPGSEIVPTALATWLAGVTIVNDLSARDVQLPQGQFYKARASAASARSGQGLCCSSLRSGRAGRNCICGSR